MTQKLSPDSILKRSPDVRFRRVLDEAVVIRQQSAETLVLNEVAVSVLEKCDGQASLDQISLAIQSEYDADPGTIHEDVVTFAGELLSSGLIETDSPQ
jgi:hypothetical protein